MIYILWSLLLTHITIMFVSVYLHRALAHKAIELHPILQHTARAWLWLFTAIIPSQWVAIHRKHHRFTDVDGDPHSPVNVGLWKILTQGTLLYIEEGKNPATMLAYGKGCPRDWLERKLYTRFNYAGLPISFGMYLFFFGWIGVIMWIVNFLWIPFWAAGVVNGVGHHFGYRSYDTRDNSRNFCPIGIIMAGEEHHNNHHAFPGSAKLSKKWFEFDSGWAWIKAFELIGLAKVIRE